MDDRQKEILKYRQVYAKYPDYRMFPDRLQPVVAALKGQSGSFLDVSCGRGELLQAAADMGFSPIMGTEAVPELCGYGITEAQIHALPFDDNAFDVVTCIDVIEHLLPQDVIPALHELQRVTRKYLLIAAADYPTYWDGENLHPSARPYSAWDQLFRQELTGSVKKVGPTSTSVMWGITYGS